MLEPPTGPSQRKREVPNGNSKFTTVRVHPVDDEPLEPEWPEADVLIGNPPFLGSKRLRAELGDQYIDRLFTLYDGRVPREADLVTYWFERARGLIAAGKAQRTGLLSG